MNLLGKEMYTNTYVWRKKVINSVKVLRHLVYTARNKVYTTDHKVNYQPLFRRNFQSIKSSLLRVQSRISLELITNV